MSDVLASDREQLKKEIASLRSENEFFREFVLYLCEEEIEENVSECELRFDKWQKENKQGE